MMVALFRLNRITMWWAFRLPNSLKMWLWLRNSALLEQGSGRQFTPSPCWSTIFF